MNFYFLNSKNENGQSMVEMIVAIAIILTGLVGALALTISNLSGSHEAGTRVVAANLAKEGIDVARNIRDTNWLQDLDWDAGLSSGDDFTAIAVFDPSLNQWQLDFAADSIGDEVAKIYLTADNLYLQDTTPPAGNETLYSRLLTIEPICFDQATKTEAIDGGPCGIGEEKTGVRVKSEVAWSESGRSRTLTLEDKLYNWR